MNHAILYKTDTCPRCRALAAHLTKIGKPFEEVNLLDLLQDADLMTDLHMAGRSFRAAPVLRVDDTFCGAEELFRDGSLDEDRLRSILA